MPKIFEYLGIILKMKIIHENCGTEVQDVIEVTEARHVGGYAIRISFNDGSEKTVDLQPFLSRSLHPSINKYLDIKLFGQFKIVNGNLNWNDHDLIFPIHDLYEGKID